jgi:uncharacterized protein YecE (DUF72 family)
VTGSFRFAIEASRYITHMKKLNDPKEPVRRSIRIDLEVDGLLEHAPEALEQPPLVRRRPAHLERDPI